MDPISCVFVNVHFYNGIILSGKAGITMVRILDGNSEHVAHVLYVQEVVPNFMYKLLYKWATTSWTYSNNKHTQKISRKCILGKHYFVINKIPIFSIIDHCI